MSREILFRGKRIKTGKWGYGDLMRAKGKTFVGEEEENIFWMDAEVYPGTVGQFTGLCDKNGVQIFEGDILTTDLIRPYVIVVFRDGSFMFNCNDGDKDYYDIMLPIMKNVQTQTLYHKVIGNIHDNPELVKEESK